MSPRLSVNINKIALIRNSREENQPNLLYLAKMILECGAHGITIHPRPDERHIKNKDVHQLKNCLNNYPNLELNIEGNPFQLKQTNNSYPGFMEILLATLPNQATLVPDKSDQLTSNHGWNLSSDYKRLEPLIKQLKEKNIRISLFVDPEISNDNLKIAKDIGADRIEIFTDKYAKSFECDFEYDNKENHRNDIIAKYISLANRAHSFKLGINAGHGLSQKNLKYFIEKVPKVEEVSIGHALISESLEDGIVATVQKYLKILS